MLVRLMFKELVVVAFIKGRMKERKALHVYIEYIYKKYLLSCLWGA